MSPKDFIERNGLELIMKMKKRMVSLNTITVYNCEIFLNTGIVKKYKWEKF